MGASIATELGGDRSVNRTPRRPFWATRPTLRQIPKEEPMYSTTNKLFEMKGDHKAALDKAEALATIAENGNRDMTANEKVLFDRHMTEARTIADAIDARENAPGSLRAQFKSGPESFFLGGTGHAAHSQPSIHSQHGRGFGTSLQEAMQTAAPGDREQVRAFAQYVGGDMTAAADLTPSGQGGIFIPALIAGVVARNYFAFTPVRNAATIWPTQDGEPTTFPVISDSDTAVILQPSALTGLDATVSGDAPPTAITGPLLGAFKFSSKPIFIPRETITDASLNILEELLLALLARIARTQNLKYTKGTGTGEPTGFQQTAAAYAAGAVALNLDIALDLAYNVPAMYRPNGLYMATDLTIKYLRKLKTGLSGDQRTLWKDAFEEGNATLGTPAKLHGYPIIVNNDMDSVATDGTFAGVSPLAFGDFKRFVIREAESGAPYVYRYPVPAKDGGAIIAFQRSDSRLLVNAAISKLTV